MQPPVGDRSWLCRFAYLNGKSCSAVDPKLLSSYGQQRNFPTWPAIWKLSWILGFSEGGAEQLEVAHGHDQLQTAVANQVFRRFEVVFKTLGSDNDATPPRRRLGECDGGRGAICNNDGPRSADREIETRIVQSQLAAGAPEPGGFSFDYAAENFPEADSQLAVEDGREGDFWTEFEREGRDGQDDDDTAPLSTVNRPPPKRRRTH